jgi:hypothetical protein
MAWDRYVTPFSYGLWLAVAISVCALGVCLALTNYGHQTKKKLSMSEIFFYIHASFCQQGRNYKSKFLPSYFLVILTLQHNLILLFHYG